MQLKAFTLLEMLVSLAVFSVAMTAVLSLTVLSANIFNSYYKTHSSMVSVKIAENALESIIVRAYALKEKNNKILAICPDDLVYEIGVESNHLILTEKGPSGQYNERSIAVKNAQNLFIDIIGSGGKSGLRYRTISQKTENVRIFLSSYDSRKKDS